MLVYPQGMPKLRYAGAPDFPRTVYFSVLNRKEAGFCLEIAEDLYSQEAV